MLITISESILLNHLRSLTVYYICELYKELELPCKTTYNYVHKALLKYLKFGTRKCEYKFGPVATQKIQSCLAVVVRDLPQYNSDDISNCMRCLVISKVMSCDVQYKGEINYDLLEKYFGVMYRTRDTCMHLDQLIRRHMCEKIADMFIDGRVGPDDFNSDCDLIDHDLNSYGLDLTTYTVDFEEWMMCTNIRERATFADYLPIIISDQHVSEVHTCAPHVNMADMGVLSTNPGFRDDVFEFCLSEVRDNYPHGFNITHVILYTWCYHDKGKIIILLDTILKTFIEREGPCNYDRIRDVHWKNTCALMDTVISNYCFRSNDKSMIPEFDEASGGLYTRWVRGN